MATLKKQRQVTHNPAGNTRYVIQDVHAPSRGVRKRQDPDHSEADFLGDLDKATQKRTKA